MKHLIVGTAGHIDHGKTELIRALTGRDTDRLREEKERGISIDLGFAEYRVGDDLLIGVVDVPGHESFIRNMLAGVTGIDLVMFVVAADEGVMPQTVEHLEILELLDIKRGIVAVTKTDLVEEEWLDLLEEDLVDHIEGTFLESAPVIRVSSRSGEGLDDVRKTLVEVASELEERRVDDLFRMPVDRVFTLKGVGTIVTGTVWSGSVSKDEGITILPGGLQTRVKSLEVHDRSVQQASAGSRTALALTGVAKDDIDRGETIVKGEVWKATDIIDVNLRCLETAGRGITNRRRVRFHLATQEVMGRVVLLEGSRLEPGEEATAQLRLEKPVVTRKGDRFVLRSYSPIRTIGGGVVIRPFARRRTRLPPEEMELLEVLIAGRPEEEILALVKAGRHEGVEVARLPLLSGIPHTEIKNMIGDLAADGRVVALDGYLFHVTVFQGAQEDVRGYLERQHRDHPLRTGFPLEEMRKKVFPRSPACFVEEVIGELTRSGSVALKGGLIKLSSHEIALVDEDARIHRDLVRKFSESGLAPPSLDQLAGELDVPEGRLLELVAVLKDTGELIPVTSDLLFSQSALEEAREKIEAFLREKGKASASELRVMLGGSRKYVIPLLEYFDRQGLTRREGDQRVLR